MKQLYSRRSDASHQFPFSAIEALDAFPPALHHVADHSNDLGRIVIQILLSSATAMAGALQDTTGSVTPTLPFILCGDCIDGPLPQLDSWASLHRKPAHSNSVPPDYLNTLLPRDAFSGHASWSSIRAMTNPFMLFTQEEVQLAPSLVRNEEMALHINSCLRVVIVSLNFWFFLLNSQERYQLSFIEKKFLHLGTQPCTKPLSSLLSLFFKESAAPVWSNRLNKTRVNENMATLAINSCPTKEVSCWSEHLCKGTKWLQPETFVVQPGKSPCRNVFSSLRPIFVPPPSTNNTPIHLATNGKVTNSHSKKEKVVCTLESSTNSILFT
ncbi:uncharacterized protein [Dermacentor albipictus]|uniref:uncharacterized protein isoform X1 n=1 Tax=Dermacentor albipictus TaxID=60249 RepID=UPI0038FD24F2